MSEMVERVARALCSGMNQNPDEMVRSVVVTDMGAMGLGASLSGPMEPRWHSFRVMAARVIEAMPHDPTEKK